MTSLEERIRRAIREKAAQVPAGMVPPLLLPVRRWRRTLPLVRGGGPRTGTSTWTARLAPAASAVLVAAVICGSVAVSRLALVRHALGRPGPSAAAPSLGAAGSKAADWVAAQVGRSVMVSCDPVMCQALRARGMPARDLEVLRPGQADPLGSAVIVATAAVRREIGHRLSSVYAPAVLASFGSGKARTDVRVIAPGGAAAYRSALSADRTARRSASAQLLRSPRIRVSAAARRQLLAGQVDSRLLTTIATMADQFGVPRPVSILAFGDSGPGAGPGIPLRSAELAATSGATSSSGLRQMLGFLRAQQAVYAAASAELARLPGGEPVLRVEFGAPSPLGLLDGNGA